MKQNTFKTQISIENLKSYFKNNGYFKSKISSDIEVDLNNKNYGKVIYKIDLGSQYYLDSIKTNIQSPLLDSIYTQNIKDSFLKKNSSFNTLSFESERNRLEKLFSDIKIQAKRIPTKPSRSSKVKRVESKKRRSKVKRSRMKVNLDD